MASLKKILVVNPGSTSTKIGLFHNEQEIWEQQLSHPADELSQLRDVESQLIYRLHLISEVIARRKLLLPELDAIVGRGGLLRPIASGVYRIDHEMVFELTEKKYGWHASNLGALLANRLASTHQIPAFIADPVCVDELDPVAKISGIPHIERRSVFHALNQKSQARRAATQLGKSYEEARLIVVHLGGGISIGAHLGGKVIDVTNAVDGEGALTPERSGSLPAAAVVRLAFSGRYTEGEMLNLINGQGGFVAYLGTNDAREVETRATTGDVQANLVFEALVYQVAKEIGAFATVLAGQVDGIVLTGGMAYSKRLVEAVEKRTKFIAPIIVFPGEAELTALAESVLCVLRGEVEAKCYGREVRP